MFQGLKNSKKQGDAGLGRAISHFCALGYPVSIPLTDSQDYDLIVEIEHELKKIQVRTTGLRVKNGGFQLNLRVLGGNSKKNFVHKKGTEIFYDFLFALTSDGTCYLIPKSAFAKHTSTLVLGPKWAKYIVSGEAGRQRTLDELMNTTRVGAPGTNLHAHRINGAFTVPWVHSYPADAQPK